MTATEASMVEDQAAKDESFRKVAALAEELIAAHGKDFTMGTLVLAARFIAQGKSFATDELSEDLKQ